MLRGSLTFSSRAQVPIPCSFWNGKMFCDSLSSPTPFLPRLPCQLPLHRVPGANCPDSLGFVCLHFRGKQLTSVSWGRRACFSSSLPVLLKCLSLKHWIFIVGLLVGNLERIKSFKRVAEACLLFWKLSFFCCVSHQCPGSLGNTWLRVEPWGQESWEPSWGRGCWLPPICPKSQARILTACPGLPGAAWQWVAWDGFTLHGPLKKIRPKGQCGQWVPFCGQRHQIGNLGSIRSLASACFPWSSGPEAPTYLGMVSWFCSVMAGLKEVWSLFVLLFACHSTP